LPWAGNHLTNFGVYGTFRSRLMVQHLSHAPRDIAILTFDLGGHDACRWCGFSLLHLFTKFEIRIGVPIRKIWHTVSLSISQPDNLDLWPLTLKLDWYTLLHVGRTTFLPFFVFARLFVLDLWANTCQTHHVTTWPCDVDLWPWRSYRLSVIRVFVLHCVPSLNFVCLRVRKIWHTFDESINWRGDLDLWPFDFWICSR